MHDGQAFGKAVVTAVREFVDRREALVRAELQAALARIAALEEHLTRPGPRP